MENPKRAKASDPAASVPGWVWFAGVMLFVAGSFQMIHGFAALERKQYFSHEIVYSNLTFWGWVFLLWGACQIIAGMLSIAGRMLGNYIGVMLAATAMILWFFMIFTTPLAAVLGVILNALVVYGLTTGAAPEWDRQAARQHHRE